MAFTKITLVKEFRDTYGLIISNNLQNPKVKPRRVPIPKV
jgi:hypothetical protein